MNRLPEMKLNSFPLNKTVLSINEGETKTFDFFIQSLVGDIVDATYVIAKENTTIDSGDMTVSGLSLQMTISNLTKGQYWLYTTYNTSTNQTRKNTWIVIVS